MGRQRSRLIPGLGGIAGGMVLPLGARAMEVERALDAPTLLAWAVLITLAGVLWLLLLRTRRALCKSDLAASRLGEQNERMRSITLHDPLTGLANRTRFIELLDLALRRLEHESGVVGVLFLDLDGFKQVNDELGHANGDRLLVEVSRRLSELVGEGEHVARIGGDEFTILCSNGTCDTEIVELAQRVRAALDSPFELDGRVAHVGASVGLTVTDDPSRLAETMLGEADVAMYEVKRHGGRAVRVFDVGTKRSVVSRHRLEEDLRGALSNGALEVLYQPLLCLRAGQPCALEALARWTDRADSPVPPRVFVPMAESLGLGRELLRVVLRHAIATLPQAERAFGRPIPIAVNVSFRQLGACDTALIIEQEIAASGVPPHLICLDITGLSPSDPECEALRALAHLRGLGLPVSVDDFGVTDVSLGALRHMPIDALKIDASLVSGLGGPADDAVVHAVIRLARGLGLRAIAEGVETKRQHARLIELGCHEAQGNFYCPPVEAGRLEISREVIDRALGKRRISAADPSERPWRSA